MRLLYALERSDLLIKATLGGIKDFLALALACSARALSRLFWRRVPYRCAAGSLRPLATIRAVLGASLVSDEVARANAAFLLGIKMRKHHHGALWARKQCLEKSAYHCEPTLIADIRDCGKMLRSYVAEVCPGRPVIFAPLHTVSDRIAAVVCTLGPARHAAIVSAYIAGTSGKDELNIVAAVGGRLDRLVAADLKGAELRHHIRAVTEGRVNLVVFPDALPEFTNAMAGRSMRTRKIEIFRRHGRLHTAVEMLSRTSNAVAVYFALHEAEGRLGIDILGHLNCSEIESSEASIIEAAVCKHWRFWLLWHCGSLFYMNPATAYE